MNDQLYQKYIIIIKPSNYPNLVDWNFIPKNSS